METEPLIDSRRIGGVLERLRLRKQLLGVHIPNQRGVFTSLILAVDPESRSFLLDELVPGIADGYLADEGRVVVRTVFNGVEIRWESQYVSEGVDDGAGYFQFRFPEQMDYRERRQSYRVKLPRDRDFAVFLRLDSDQVFEGRIADISFGGIRIEFDHADVVAALDHGELKPGVEIPDVEICFEGEERSLRFSVEVRHTKTKDVGVGLRRRRVVQCSVRFRDLQQNVAGRLRGIIQTQQRQVISEEKET